MQLRDKNWFIPAATHLPLVVPVFTLKDKIKTDIEYSTVKNQTIIITTILTPSCTILRMWKQSMFPRTEVNQLTEPSLDSKMKLHMSKAAKGWQTQRG